MEKLRISLKAARVNAGYSQRKAAKLLKICVSSLQNYEAGKVAPSWDVVKRIEDLYGIPADNIFFDSKYA